MGRSLRPMIILVATVGGCGSDAASTGEPESNASSDSGGSSGPETSSTSTGGDIEVCGQAPASPPGPDAGSVVWDAELGPNDHPRFVALHGNRVWVTGYAAEFGTSRPFIRVFDLETGAPQWEYELSVFGEAWPTGIVVDDDGALLVARGLDPDTEIHQRIVARLNNDGEVEVSSSEDFDELSLSAPIGDATGAMFLERRCGGEAGAGCFKALVTFDRQAVKRSDVLAVVPGDDAGSLLRHSDGSLIAVTTSDEGYVGETLDPMTGLTTPRFGPLGTVADGAPIAEDPGCGWMGVHSEVVEASSNAIVELFGDDGAPTARFEVDQGLFDMPRAVAVHPSGHLLVAGFTGTPNFEDGIADLPALTQLDRSGAIRWSFPDERFGVEYARGEALTNAPDGSIVLTWSTEATAHVSRLRP